MEVLLPKFNYYLDESDPDVVVLTRQDNSFVAAFSAQVATSKVIVEAAREDYRALIKVHSCTLQLLEKERPRDERALKPSCKTCSCSNDALLCMAKKSVTDELWEIAEPLLPPEPPKPKGGRPRVPNRAALTGILFILKMGIPWVMLPKDMGCGSGSTCWRRLQEWRGAGVWRELHRVLLDRLGHHDEIDWSRAYPNSRSLSATRRARRSPRIRRLMTDWARGAT
jgi:transposase